MIQSIAENQKRNMSLYVKKPIWTEGLIVAAKPASPYDHHIYYESYPLPDRD